jgi:flavodoxin
MDEMRFFDPSETVRGIQQVLVSDKKKIAFLFGAGTSLARRNNDAPFVPAVAKLTELVEAEISKTEELKDALDEIKDQQIKAQIDYNVETLLTNVEDKIRIIGGGSLNGLNKAEFENLAEIIRKQIRDIVSVHTKIKPGQESLLVQYDFAKWIKSADRKFAVEIFTTNYDYLIELGLEALDVPYYDGFTGGYMPFFNADSLEDVTFLPRQTKLWKIHGSLGLHEVEVDSKKKIVRKGSDSKDLLIYPSSFKYSNSKKLPYAAFMDRLNDFLKQDDAVLFVCGYSFGDEHINERILSALNTNSTSHVFVLFYDIEGDGNNKKYTLTKDCKLSRIASGNRRISVLGMRNAVIGSAFGTWKLKRKPDIDTTLTAQKFYKEDEPADDAGATADGQQAKTTWTGEGELTLPGFARFVDFLKNMIPKNEWEDDLNG